MIQKSRKPFRGTLQTWKMVEITDPAEIAALERRIRVAEKALAQREGMNTKSHKPLHGVSITSVQGELVEITDTAKITALERRIRAAKKPLAAREKPQKAKPRK